MNDRKPALIPYPRKIRMTGTLCQRDFEPEIEKRDDMGESYTLEIAEDRIRITGGNAGIFPKCALPRLAPT